MNVVIPLRTRPNLINLNAAIASIHASTCYRVVIIGGDPNRSDVDHIATEQGRNKFANTEKAMRTACQTRWISDPFIWSNDDIFWTQPAKPIRWAIGDLRDDTRKNIYGQRKRNTANILEALGYPTFDYESHTPLPVTKAPMLEALTLGGTMRSAYGNLTGQPDLIAPDVKHATPNNDTPWVSSPRGGFR